MPRKLPSSGLIQFGKQLDMFEDAVIHVATIDQSNEDAVTDALHEKEKQKKLVLQLFKKKGN